MDSAFWSYSTTSTLGVCPSAPAAGGGRAQLRDRARGCARGTGRDRSGRERCGRRARTSRPRPAGCSGRSGSYGSRRASSSTIPATTRSSRPSGIAPARVVEDPHRALDRDRAIERNRLDEVGRLADSRPRGRAEEVGGIARDQVRRERGEHDEGGPETERPRTPSADGTGAAAGGGAATAAPSPTRPISIRLRPARSAVPLSTSKSERNARSMMSPTLRRAVDPPPRLGLGPRHRQSPLGGVLLTGDELQLLDSRSAPIDRRAATRPSSRRSGHSSTICAASIRTVSVETGAMWSAS